MAMAATQSDTRDVKVQLYLAGGHHYITTLASDDPRLHDLFAALMTQSLNASAAAPKFFQIPLDGGRAACSFSSGQLVSIVTEPPVLVQVEQPSVQTALSPVVPTDYLQIDDFLTPDEQAELLVLTLQHNADFKASTVTSDERDARHSQVYFDVQNSALAAVFRSRLQTLLPYVLRRFKQPSFPVSHIEVQLTAHRQGDYFIMHKDSGANTSTALREITYVYYFYREPKAFSGGELKLYNHRMDRGISVAAVDSFRLIEPLNNHLVVFSSHAFHEVMPVQMTSPEFADSRFTINGWVNREGENQERVHA